jgi:hypothetical protein
LLALVDDRAGAIRVSHSEISANRLIELRSNSRDFSECPLINIRKKLDFDSAAGGEMLVSAISDDCS